MSPWSVAAASQLVLCGCRYFRVSTYNFAIFFRKMTILRGFVNEFIYHRLLYDIEKYCVEHVYCRRYLRNTINVKIIYVSRIFLRLQCMYMGVGHRVEGGRPATLNHSPSSGPPRS